MHITLSGVHIEITEAIHDYALDKMGTLNKFIKHDDTSSRLEITLTKTTGHHSHGDFYQAEGVLHMSGKTIALKSKEDDLYKAIDILKDMMTRELTSHKDKKHSVLKRGAHRIKALLKRGI